MKMLSLYRIYRPRLINLQLQFTSRHDTNYVNIIAIIPYLLSLLQNMCKICIFKNNIFDMNYKCPSSFFQSQH